MDNKKKELISALLLALCIAIFPPLWAVFSASIGIVTGAVSLVCAGVYVAHGNKKESVVSMCLGFLVGDLWAFIAVTCINNLPINPSLAVFITLSVFGFLAVMIGHYLKEYIFLPSWLCGWAIGMVILAPMKGSLINMTLQIGIAMLVGVVGIGYAMDRFHGYLNSKFNK